MTFHSRNPAAPVGLFVDRLWLFSGGGFDHTRECVLPDGGADLVIQFEDTPRHRFDPANPRRRESVRRAWICGLLSRPTLIDVLPHATMMGAHFKPGGLAPFLLGPADELAGQLVEVDQLWTSEGTELRERLFECSMLARRFDILEEFLQKRLAKGMRFDPAVQATVLRLALAGPTPPIVELAKASGFSHKHFIRRFQQSVGLTPKTFARLQRFQFALAHMQNRRLPVDGAGLAAACGYFDQAHFIHDFQSFSGMTPSAYLRSPGADARFVPLTD